jgi:hypothetical protein
MFATLASFIACEKLLPGSQPLLTTGLVLMTAFIGFAIVRMLVQRSRGLFGVELNLLMDRLVTVSESEESAHSHTENLAALQDSPISLEEPGLKTLA